MDEDFKIFEYAISNEWNEEIQRIVVFNREKDNIFIKFEDEKIKKFTVKKYKLEEIINIINNKLEIFGITVVESSKNMTNNKTIDEFYFSNGETTNLIRIKNLSFYTKEDVANDKIECIYDVYDDIEEIIKEETNEEFKNNFPKKM